MPRVTRRKSQKAGSCSFVTQDRNRKVRKGSRKARRSQRAGGCGYSGEPRRAGAKRSMRGGGTCVSGGTPHTHDNQTRRSMRGGYAKGGNNNKEKKSRKARSSNRKRAVVMCNDGSANCGRRL